MLLDEPGNCHLHSSICNDNWLWRLRGPTHQRHRTTRSHVGNLTGSPSPPFLGFSRYMLIMVFSSRRLASSSSYLLPTERCHSSRTLFSYRLVFFFFLFHSKRPRILGESDEQIRPRVFNTDTVFQKNGIQKSTLAATSLRYNSSPGFKFIQMFFVVITLQACLVRDRTCA